MSARCPCREYAGTLQNVDFSEIAEYCGSLLKAQQYVSFSANRKPGKSCYIYIGADCVIDTICRDKDPLWCDQSTTTDVQCEMWVCVGDHPMAATPDCWIGILQRTLAMVLPLQSYKTCLSGLRSFVSNVGLLIHWLGYCARANNHALVVCYMIAF